MRRSRHLVHPRRRRLLAWLDADDVAADPRVTAHLNTCARCASLLDDVEAADDVETADAVAATPLAVAIRDVWTVPDELPERIHRAIDQRVRAERELELLLGLVTISKDTAELLLPSEEDEKEEPT